MLSQTAFIPQTPTIASRRIAILIADGFDLPQVTAVRAALSSQSALPFINGSRRGLFLGNRSIHSLRRDLCPRWRTICVDYARKWESRALGKGSFPPL